MVAIEGLSGANFSCNSFEETERSGLQILCNEAVRFTHAFTSSPMAQPALGSILTGELPSENGLRDNGRTFLTAKQLTLAEKLIPKHKRTLFVASAPTVKRYSRLHQGFENFNDDYELTANSIYRPIADSIRIFKNWLQNEVIGSSFFAVIHASDLLFPQVITQTELLESRARGPEGQFEEVDENLYLLFNHLKQNNLWNNTYIILTGLNGTTDSARNNEIPGANLFAENVSVPLFIKALKGREEIPHQWKVDAHVTLQDVGMTLEEIFNVSNEEPRSNNFRGASLMSLINGKSDTRFSNRPIMIESAWSTWALQTLPRISVRDSQWLVIFDKYPLLYNTLTDRAEVNRVSLKDSEYQLTVEQLAGLFVNPLPQGYEKPDALLNQEFLFARLLHENEGRFIETMLPQIRTFVQNNLQSETIRWLLVEQLIRRKKWDLIEEFNREWQDTLIQKVLELKSGNPSQITDYGCLDLLVKARGENALTPKNTCENKEFLLMVDWLFAPSSKKDLLLERFAVIAKYHALNLKLISFDLSRGGVVIGANTKKLKNILMFKLALGLPAFHKDASLLEKHL
ncbi:MAG: hypothetical protein RJB66_2316 [Pseudomonadota bacterium]